VSFHTVLTWLHDYIYNTLINCNQPHHDEARHSPRTKATVQELSTALSLSKGMIPLLATQCTTMQSKDSDMFHCCLCRSSDTSMFSLGHHMCTYMRQSCCSQVRLCCMVCACSARKDARCSQFQCLHDAWGCT
jgi:hypothetical protein